MLQQRLACATGNSMSAGCQWSRSPCKLTFTAWRLCMAVLVETVYVSIYIYRLSILCHTRSHVMTGISRTLEIAFRMFQAWIFGIRILRESSDMTWHCTYTLGHVASCYSYSYDCYSSNHIDFVQLVVKAHYTSASYAWHVQQLACADIIINQHMNVAIIMPWQCQSLWCDRNPVSQHMRAALH